MSDLNLSDLTQLMMPSADLVSSIAINNSEERKDTILKLFQNDLDRHRMSEVLDMFKRAIVPEVEQNGTYIIWDLVPLICQRLRGLSEFRFKTFNLCCQLLLDICEITNPKELLIIYLAELENDLNLAKYPQNDVVSDIVVEEDNEDNQKSNKKSTEFTDSNCFKALLKPFEILLLKLPRKRNETLKSVLVQLNEHVTNLSISFLKDDEFQKNDRFMMLKEPPLKNIVNVSSIYVDFLETFVKEVQITVDTSSQLYISSQSSTKTSDPNIQRLILLKALFRVLDKPLNFLDTMSTPFNDAEVNPYFSRNGTELSTNTSSNKNETSLTKPYLVGIYCDEARTVRFTLIKVINLIACLHSNYYTLFNRLDLIDKIQNSEEIFLSKLHFDSAFSLMSYILITRPTTSPGNFVPRVYTHIHNFVVHLPYVRHFLDESDYLMNNKGLTLLTTLLERIGEHSLEDKFLDLLRKNSLVNSLIAYITSNFPLNARLEALALLKKLILCFEPIGRYKILYSMLSQPNQKYGILEQVIIMYKDLLPTNQIYQGTNLHRWVRTMINLFMPISSDDDLMNHRQMIFSTINFLRFIFLYDTKSQNSTGIWDIISFVTNQFLIALQNALEIWRTNNKRELCDLTLLKMEMAKNSEDKSKKHIVCKDEPQEYEIVIQHRKLLLSLQNYEFTESLLVRLLEIIDEQSDM